MIATLLIVAQLQAQPTNSIQLRPAQVITESLDIQRTISHHQLQATINPQVTQVFGELQDAYRVGKYQRTLDPQQQFYLDN